MSGVSETICNNENTDSSVSKSHCSIGLSVCNMQPKEVLEEFKKLYESRIKRIERESPSSTELKVAALEEWVQELYKQNVMLIEAAEELEREACERVSLLEARLKCSARAARESTLRFQHYESQAADASAEGIKAEKSLSPKSKSDQLLSEHQQFQLRKEVAGLRCDIAGLLHFIRRAVKTDNWNISDLTFFEVSQDELLSILKEKEREDKINGGIINSRSKDLSKIASVLEQEVIDKDSIIARLETEVTELSQELALCESANEIGRLGISISENNETVRQLQQQLQSCEEENEKHIAKINRLQEEILEKRNLIIKLRNHITQVEKESREARDVLTNEVAEKHDQVLFLRGENEKLEESLHKACMQTRFKDDIIKEMRHEIRSSRAKVVALEFEIQNHHLECRNPNHSRYQLENKTKSHFPAEKPDLSSHPHRIPNSDEKHRNVDSCERPSSSLLHSSCSSTK